MKIRPLDLQKLRVRPVAERRSLTSVEEILLAPDSTPRGISPPAGDNVRRAAEQILAARERGAGVILMYGAHLLRNGAVLILTEMMARGWITHLATNGAGTIHDWEFAWLGRSSESVEQNVATGTFGAWDETGRSILVALMAGALHGHGYGRSLGKFIHEDGTTLPPAEDLERMVAELPADPLASAAADLLSAMRRHRLPEGPHVMKHAWKHASILAQAWRLGVPVTVHPGIGYDIIACHPLFQGSVVGRAAGEDFRVFCGAVDGLDGGVLLAVGSAIMAPQVFEKSLSCVHNLRFQDGRGPVAGLNLHIVDLQDGGNWDWTKGEPPRTNPAYYLRFCKSFSRMGGEMHYSQCDNVTFMHHLYRELMMRTGGGP